MTLNYSQVLIKYTIYESVEKPLFKTVLESYIQNTASKPGFPV